MPRFWFSHSRLPWALAAVLPAASPPLSPLQGATVLRKPYAQDASPTAITIMWETDAVAAGIVDYGLTPALGRQVKESAARTRHLVRLTGLQPQTQYNYRVRLASDPAGSGELLAFKTLPPPESPALRFIVLGDSGSDSSQQWALAEFMNKSDPDLVLHVGDVAPPEWEEPNIQNLFFNVYAPLLSRRPFYLALGNHDIGNADGFVSTFEFPKNNSDKPEYYYSFDAGPVHIVCLATDYNRPRLVLEPGTPQYEWLRQDLKATRQPWKVAFFHHPPYTSGAHRNDDDNDNGIPDQEELRASLGALLAQYAVDAAFYGHDHHYERILPRDGVQYIKTGGGGCSLRTFVQRDFTAAIQKIHHVMEVSVSGGSMLIEQVAFDGSRPDRVRLLRDSFPPAPIRDLRVTAWAGGRARLAWTATGDDGIEGQAARNELRRSDAPIRTEADWAAAAVVAPAPGPGPAGAAQQYEISGLAQAATHYFAIRAWDEFRQASPLSNCAATAPGTDTDQDGVADSFDILPTAPYAWPVLNDAGWADGDADADGIADGDDLDPWNPYVAGAIRSLWNTPLLEMAGTTAIGGDNLIGERFDFAETGPFPKGAGKMADPGTLHVNNDKNALYLGLRGLGLPQSAYLVLFLEVPGLRGVARLRGLGNGRPDPQGEGADALDLAAHLEFVNFRPSVALILGDERADLAGTAPPRDWLRPGAQFAGGQGAFSLSSGFPGLRDIMIRQFNSSPQRKDDDPDDIEQSANYIEIAIPHARLGDLAPGQIMHAAGVILTGALASDGTAALEPGAVIGRRLAEPAPGLARVWGVPILLDAHSDTDGVSDARDLDDDGDGVPDTSDAYPTDPTRHLWEGETDPEDPEDPEDPPDLDQDGIPDDVDPYPGDTDNDGIPNWLDPDDDNDGAPDATEQRAGTDPFDPESVLRIERVRLMPGTPCSVMVDWIGMPNHRYIVQVGQPKSPDGGLVWTDLNYPGSLVSGAAGEPQSLSYRDASMPHDASAPIMRLYRIVHVAP